MGSRRMKVLGLTGSIGMGKSTAAGLLRRLGVPLHDGDASVHRLLAPGGGAVAAVAAAFPGAARDDGGIDRARLGALVFADPERLRRLEAILHPLVRAERQRFLRRMRAARKPLAVLDVPLLFETGADSLCDAVIVMTAPHFLQRQRVLQGRKIPPERLAEIERRQMPDAEKRRRADFVVPSGNGRRPVLAALRRILRKTRGRRS